MIDDQEFLNVLVQQGLINQSLSEEIGREVFASGKDPVSILIDFQVITEEAQAWQAVAEQLNAEYLDLSTWQAPEAIHTLMPGSLVRLHGALRPMWTSCPTRPPHLGRRCGRSLLGKPTSIH